MRFVRFSIVVALVSVAGWLVAQSVSVKTSGEKVEITIHRQKLSQAGRELKDQGRRAVVKVGQALEQAGHKFDENAEPESRHYAHCQRQQFGCHCWHVQECLGLTASLTR